jgi:hypothetical protein
MLWTILVILLVLWLIGVLSHVGGGLIRGGCGCIDYQPGYRTASGLEVSRKGAKKPAKAQRKAFKDKR